MNIPGLKYGYNPPAHPRRLGELKILEAPRDPNIVDICLHIVDEETNTILFTVHARQKEPGQEGPVYDQDDLWWNAECLVHYFNMSPPSDTGGIS